MTLAKLKAWLDARRKAAVAASGALILWGLTVYYSAAPGVTEEEWKLLVPLALGVLGVHHATNTPAD